MQTQVLIDRLDRFPAMLAAVLKDVSGDDARWKPDHGAWSILEITSHLADEELEDFPRRLELTLRDPALDWPPIDPETAAVERRYNEGDLAEVLARFTAARRKSVAWVRRLEKPEWSTTHRHPRSSLRAGDLFASWVDHDVLHLRQIVKRLHEMIQRDGGDYETAYAGKWTA